MDYKIVGPRLVVEVREDLEEERLESLNEQLEKLIENVYICKIKHLETDESKITQVPKDSTI